MKFYPDFESFKGYAKEFKSIPVMSEMMADMVTPVNLFLGVRQQNKYCYLLESAENERQSGRYSIIGYDPETIVSYKDGRLSVKKETAKDEWSVSEKITRSPLSEIDEIIKENSSPVMPGMPKYTNGLVGYFSYDTARLVEPTVSACPPDDLGAADIMLMGFRRSMVFDHLKKTVIFITSVPLAGDLSENYSAAERRLREMSSLLQGFRPDGRGGESGEFTTRALVSRAEFIDKVKKAKEHIFNGDIFQVVLSQRFEIENPPDPFKVYRALRSDEPSQYMYCMTFDSCEIVGSSPEKLVSVENGLVANNPIAGTIKRGKTEAEDKELESRLLNDEKERAEHIMLVDLSRNDLGRICDFGTVNVDKLMQIGRFSKIMHIVSEVTGNLKSGMELTDVLGACLPAGTLSGAPKIRAMQIIDGLETRKRGLYGGAIGFVGYNGMMNTCIAIRTAFFVNGKAYIQAGAGIVADSDPDAEYEELSMKAAAMLAAFEKAGEIV